MYDSEMNEIKKKVDKLIAPKSAEYQQGRADGAREFAEWFANKMNFSKEWVNYQIEHWKQNGTVITFQRKEED